MQEYLFCFWCAGFTSEIPIRAGWTSSQLEQLVRKSKWIETKGPGAARMFPILKCTVLAQALWLASSVGAEPGSGWATGLFLLSDEASNWKLEGCFSNFGLVPVLAKSGFLRKRNWKARCVNMFSCFFPFPKSLELSRNFRWCFQPPFLKSWPLQKWNVGIPTRQLLQLCEFVSLLLKSLTCTSSTDLDAAWTKRD